MPRKVSAEQADEQAQERAQGPAPRAPRVARGYVHATHPETGLEVVFVPGEAVPDWAPVSEAVE